MRSIADLFQHWAPCLAVLRSPAVPRCDEASGVLVPWDCDHSQLQSVQIEKAEAECSRLEMLLEQRDQQLLSHAQNEHPHEYKELVEVLSREEKLKAKLAEVEKRHEACEEPLIERGCLRKGKEGE